jgi:hypothetical protein
MGEIDAACDIATGALLGRVVENRAGETHGDHEAMCLNCGTALLGAHCHACGQAGHVHRSLGAIGHEILHGVAHFEGKLWRTLPMLVWRPGELTRRYIAGERARFVSPMAIFLFSIFAMFAVFSFTGITTPGDLGGFTAKPAQVIAESREKAIEKRREAREKLAKLAADDPGRARLERRIASAEEDLRGLDEAAKHVALEPNGSAVAHTGWSTLDHGVEKWQKNPSLMLYKLQSSSYKFSWLLIPLSLPFLWLLFFWKREYKLYDHTVFVTYSIAFMSLLFIALTLAATAGMSGGWIALIAMLVPLVHIARHLKQAYRSSWGTTILRTLVLTFFIGIVLMLFASLLALMGMMG